MASWSLFVLYRSGDTPLEEVLDSIRGPLREVGGEIDETKRVGQLLTEEEKQKAIWCAWFWNFFGPHDVDSRNEQLWQLMDYTKKAAAASDTRYALQLVPASQLQALTGAVAADQVDALRFYVEEGRAKVVLFCSEIA